MVFLLVVNLSSTNEQGINSTNKAVAFEREKLVSVYFVLDKGDTAIQNSCASSTPLDRMVLNAETLGLGALEKLVAGPSPLEKRKGYKSYIKEGARLKSFKIVDSVAHVYFDGDYINTDDFSGAQEDIECSNTAKAQIERTLTALPDIDSVVIESN